MHLFFLIKIDLSSIKNKKNLFILKYFIVPGQVVKVADFGVARVQTQSGVMTAETGTYRWMAPEVCIFLDMNF